MQRRNGYVIRVIVHNGEGTQVELPVTDLSYSAGGGEKKLGEFTLTVYGTRVRFEDIEAQTLK